MNKPFKDIMKKRWIDWIESGEADFTDKRNRNPVSYQLVAEWVDDKWKKFATDYLVMKASRQCDLPYR